MGCVGARTSACEYDFLVLNEMLVTMDRFDLMKSWQAPSIRNGAADPFELSDDLFVTLECKKELAAWANNQLRYRTKEVEWILAKLRIPEKIIYIGPGWESRSKSLSPLERVHDYAIKAQQNLMDILDFIVHVTSNEPTEFSESLDFLFLAHNLNYQISDEYPRYILPLVLPTTQNRYLDVVQTVNDHCAGLLSDAWRNAYGYDGDPDESWKQSVKAVENLLHPIASPNDPSAVYTKMVNQVRQAPQNFVSTYPLKLRPGSEYTDDNRVEEFVSLLDRLTYQPGRHGQDTTQPTIEEARTQVNIAVTICQLLTEDVLKRR